MLYSPSAGYGWISTAALTSCDRVLPDDLRRDTVRRNTQHTFNLDLKNGDYEVTVIISDQLYGCELIDVYVKDALVIDGLPVYASVFQEVTVYITVMDGQLNLRILDDGGTLCWVIAALAIEQGFPPTPPSSGSLTGLLTR
jgi:hypothetical protein